MFEGSGTTLVAADANPKFELPQLPPPEVDEGAPPILVENGLRESAQKPMYPCKKVTENKAIMGCIFLRLKMEKFIWIRVKVNT